MHKCIHVRVPLCINTHKRIMHTLSSIATVCPHSLSPIPHENKYGFVTVQKVDENRLTEIIFTNVFVNVIFLVILL